MEGITKCLEIGLIDVIMELDRESTVKESHMVHPIDQEERGVVVVIQKDIGSARHHE